ncbi:hypothetical protein CK203_018974 [Vitis vinifera]|uniref:Uncharacterized protein n=1 Tax=Vitis vinifera TaxID=29760 RepID=A0A438IQS8_VITVI|nr:hypothetical protein CK203_018974 [Vitis vinifera]
MARTRGAKSSSPSNRKRSLRKEPSPGSVPEPAPKPSPSRPQPSPVKPAHQSRGKAIFTIRRSAIEEEAQVPSPVPSPIPSPEPTPFHRRYHLRHPKKKIRSLKRQFQSPKLQLKHLWKKVRPELPILPAAEEISYGASASSKDFFYPRVVTDFYQTMTTKEPTQFDNFKAWTNPTELEMVSTLSRGAANRIGPKEGVLLEALYKMSEGFFFGPHHLIMAALLYFEEKVHKKKLQRADCIPLLFPRLLCKFWSISDTPLSLNRKEREYAESSPRHPPKGITLATPAIPRASPAAPAPSQPSTSAEPRMAIPISEYRELCRALETLTASQSNLAQELAAIKACQDQMLASQAQQAAILRQLQVHFDLPQAVEPSTDSTRATLSAFRVSSSRAEASADPATEEADPSA